MVCFSAEKVQEIVEEKESKYNKLEEEYSYLKEEYGELEEACQDLKKENNTLKRQKNFNESECYCIEFLQRRLWENG